MKDAFSLSGQRAGDPGPGLPFPAILLAWEPGSEKSANKGCFVFLRIKAAFLEGEKICKKQLLFFLAFFCKFLEQNLSFFGTKKTTFFDHFWSAAEAV